VWAEKRRVQTRQGAIAVVDLGDPEAPPLVLLAGTLTSSYLWRNLAPLLASSMRVIAPDLLGSGDSATVDDADLTLRGHAASLREALERLGIERFALVGHADGGGVAQLLALDVPVEALVLIDAIAFDAWPPDAIRDLRRAIDGGEEIDAPSRARELLATGVSHHERLSESDLDAYVAPFEGPDGGRRFRRAIASLDGHGLTGLEPRLASLDVPALVMWGEDDAFVDPGVAERLGDVLPRASVALLPGCGHLLLDDATETVVPLLFQWLRSSYLGVEHRHETGPIAVEIGRRPMGEDR
jgi:pimeloyl-ACP methyl ester carboxylesterase